jgi:hypothetical protein
MIQIWLKSEKKKYHFMFEKLELVLGGGKFQI